MTVYTSEWAEDEFGNQIVSGTSLIDLSSVTVAELVGASSAYNYAYAYHKGDTVLDQGALWVYVNDVDGSGNAPPALPDVSNAYWELISIVASEKFTWIAYANYDPDTQVYTDFTLAQSNENGIIRKWIGIAVNQSTAIESTNPLDYSWSKFVGEDGVSGDTPDAPLVAYVTRENIIVPTDTNGDNGDFISAGGLNLYVYQGNEILQYHQTASISAGEWWIQSLSIEPSSSLGLAVENILDQGSYAEVPSITSMSADTVRVTFNIQAKSTSGVITYLSKDITYNKFLGAVVDNTPPIATEGLSLSTYTITSAGGDLISRIVATWTENTTNTDISYYEVEIKQTSQTDASYINFQTALTTYEWTVAPNVSYTVRARSIDKNDNRSSYSNPEVIISATGDADYTDTINNGPTTINADKILIGNTTYLSSWRNGGDNTKIEGGAIAANTVSANKLYIGNRGVDISGIQFQAQAALADQLTWTAGTIIYTDDTGTVITLPIDSGSVTWSTGTLYIYWVKGASTISSNTATGVAYGPNNIVLATYTGGTGLVVNYGRTIIDGSHITTGTINGNKLIANSVTADRIDSRGLSIKDASGNIILAAGSAVDFLNLSTSFPNSTNQNSITNSEISISSNGTLNGAGGGQVTLSGVGFTGDTDAQRNSRITIAGGQLQGIGTGAGTTVANNLITVDGSGQIQGIGSGAGTAIANSAITISSGAISGIGTGSGTEVANSTTESRQGRWQWKVDRYATNSTINPSGTVPSYELVNKASLDRSIYLPNTTTSFSFNSDNYFGVASCSIYSPSAWSWTVTVNHDDAGRIYLNGQSIYSNQIGTYSVTINFPSGWSLLELLWAEQGGGDVFGLSQAISARTEITDMWASTTSIPVGQIASAATTSVWSGVTGAGKPSDNANNTYVDGSGNIQGVSSGAGTAVSNNSITVDANGVLQGTGTANVKVDNSAISISSSGALSGAGGGQVTLGGIGFTGDTDAQRNSRITVDANGVLQGTGASNIVVNNTFLETQSFVTTGTTVIGNTIKKTATTGDWDSQAYSKDGYTNGAFASFSPDQTGVYQMAGLNTDPSANASYNTIDYAFYMNGTSDLRVYESSADRGSVGTYAVGDILSVTYDGSRVQYIKNGTVLRTVPVTISNPLYFDSSFVNSGASISKVRFGPMSSNNWDQITNQPAGIYNSNITISANGTLNNAGGGQVTLSGVGFTGDTDAQRNSRITVASGQLSGIGTAGVYVDNTYTSTPNNLIPNSDQTSSITMVQGWNPNGATFDATLQYASNVGSWAGSYILSGVTTRNLYVHQNNITAGGDDAVALDIYPTGGWDTARIPVQANEKYIFSCYLQGHRCKGAVGIAWWDAAGNQISSVESGPQTLPYGQAAALSQYSRVYTIGTAPSNAASASLFIRKYNTLAGNTESYFWLAAPMFERVNSNTATPGPYVPGPALSTRQLGYSGDLNATNGATIGSNLNGQFTESNISFNFASNSIPSTYIKDLAANKITAGTISVGVAVGDEKVKIDGSKRQILIKDLSGNVRVKIGDLSV